MALEFLITTELLDTYIIKRDTHRTMVFEEAIDYYADEVHKLIVQFNEASSATIKTKRTPNTWSVTLINEPMTKMVRMVW